MKSAVLTLSAALMLCGCQQSDHAIAAEVPPAETDPQETASALYPARNDSETARDRYRHPAETLMFFDVHPDQVVVELWPGSGWYTAVLAPFLKKDGQLIAAHFPADSNVRFFRESRSAFNKRFLLAPEVYGNIYVTELEPPTHLGIARSAEADRVLTFRNVHNWMRNSQEQSVFDEAYRVLKPGGILGVVEHRAADNFTRQQMIESGYVSEAYVTQLAINAGFVPAGHSEINANPRDTRDHPHGVWSLPPTLRGGEENRALFESIGESDRMTLKFRKP
ncbi:MAG: methyltransferase [Thalassolituus sp.]